jgi:hypothetical protein
MHCDAHEERELNSIVAIDSLKRIPAVNVRVRAAAIWVPGEIQSAMTIGPRAGVSVITTSAPRTVCSRLVVLISKLVKLADQFGQ